MNDKRLEPRLMCADLVDVEWPGENGTPLRVVANLEDISQSGACLQMESEIAVETPVKISYPNGELRGTVRYCVYCEIGYFIGIEFHPDQKWSQRVFRPLHLFNPESLTHHRIDAVFAKYFVGAEK